MNRRYQYHEKEMDKKFIINSMTKYLKEKQEIDKELEKIIAPYIESRKLNILDACCGIGHISYFLSKIWLFVYFLMILNMFLLFLLFYL